MHHEGPEGLGLGFQAFSIIEGGGAHQHKMGTKKKFRFQMSRVFVHSFAQATLGKVQCAGSKENVFSVFFLPIFRRKRIEKTSRSNRMLVGEGQETCF